MEDLDRDATRRLEKNPQAPWSFPGGFTVMGFDPGRNSACGMRYSSHVMEHCPCELAVQLYLAPLPHPLSRIAVHHWFVISDPELGRPRRWEVWQRADVLGASWGHIHLDLKAPEAGVGGGPAVVQAEWRGEAADRIRAVVEDPLRYPHRSRYRYWPGPNSNTYVAWVLREAGVEFGLDRRAFGKHYTPTLIRIAAIRELCSSRLPR